MRDCQVGAEPSRSMGRGGQGGADWAGRSGWDEVRGAVRLGWGLMVDHRLEGLSRSDRRPRDERSRNGFVVVKD